MDAGELTRRLELARIAAIEAGQVALRYFGIDNLAIERKGDNSPVTIADREAEAHLRSAISQAFPQDAILGEELGDVSGTSGFRWILDPIDGTKAFICGVPLWATLVGVEHEGQSLVGVIHVPALAETAWAAKGQGGWFKRGDGAVRRTSVSRKARLADCLFCTSEVKNFGDRGRLPAYSRVQQAAWITRTWGDAYGYLLVATGRADVMIDPVMNVWDCAALAPVLEEAGGTFTDWRGSPTIHAGEAVATNGLILPEVLALLAPTSEPTG